MARINIVELGYKWITCHPYSENIPVKNLAQVLEFATWAQEKYNKSLSHNLSDSEQELYDNNEE